MRYLGYACTAYRAQGRTVDTAHATVSITTTREVLYVAATRGRTSNRLYVDTYYDPDAQTAHAPVEPLAPREVLAHVLDNAGADLAATTTQARERDRATSIATLAREYLTIAREAQAARWDALIARPGLTPAQQQTVTQSPAYGPLLAALRTAESRGLDVTAALPTLIASRTLADAEDVASVLHERVDQWVTAAAGGTGRRARDRTIVGLFARADGITDPDMRRALDERSGAMERRAADLVDRALARAEPWIAALGAPPHGAGARRSWLQEARTVAAFRELHHVTGPVPAALQDSDGSLMGLCQARTAITAWRRAQAITEQDHRQTDGATSIPTADLAVTPALEA